MKRLFTICIFLVLNCSLFSVQSRVTESPTFEMLSGKWDEKKERWRKYSDEDAMDLDAFAMNFQSKSRHLFFSQPYTHRIPRVLNFIWVGPRPFPEDSIENLKAWQALHPGWTMRFWTDSEERTAPIEGMEKHLIDEIDFLRLKPYLEKTKNYGEKADLIRYEIIYQQGGVYIDHDVMPYRSFDILNNAFDFYVGLENPHVNPGTETKVFPCNCLFGARPYHPILRETIELCVSRWKDVEKKYSKDDPKTNKNRVINRTFHSFTLATKKCLNLEGNSDIVLPSSFFFAYKIFNDKTIDKLKSYGYVFARHDFASIWTGKDKKESESSSDSSESKKKTKSKSKKKSP